MINESSYSNAQQKYGKKKVDAIILLNKTVTKNHIYKICQFVYDEQIDPFKAILVMKKIDGLIKNGIINLGGYNQMKFGDFCKILKKCNLSDFNLPNQIYESNDGMISIGEFKDFNDAKTFFKHQNNHWCICQNLNWWNQYKYNADNSINTIYLIRNEWHDNVLKYVIVIAYPNQTFRYWDFKNRLMSETETMSYNRTIGDGVNYLKSLYGMHLESEKINPL